MKKFIAGAVALIAIITMSSCNSSSGKTTKQTDPKTSDVKDRTTLIQRKWYEADVLGAKHGKAVHWDKTNLEFTKEGIMKVWDRQTILWSDPYKMDSDGKSFVFTDKNSNRPMKVNIIDLNEDSLVIYLRFFGPDTLILKPAKTN